MPLPTAPKMNTGLRPIRSASAAKLEAMVEGAPDVSEEDLVDEILSRQQG